MSSNKITVNNGYSEKKLEDQVLLQNSEYYNAYIEQSREKQRGQPLKVYTSTGGIKSAKGPRVFRATVFSGSPQLSPKSNISQKESASALIFDEQRQTGTILSSNFTSPRLSTEQIRQNRRFNVKVLQNGNAKFQSNIRGGHSINYEQDNQQSTSLNQYLRQHSNASAASVETLPVNSTTVHPIVPNSSS